MSGDDEQLHLLRKVYEEALDTYAGISATLNRHVLAGIKPSRDELLQEEHARAALQNARSRYLEAWRLSVVNA